ncbi:hypothetical protein [Vibrio penaeicida]|uniref:hypothetical protein n=1 Tax=Vibrio penaeicida TaxID=104609 RepID=UPI0011748562|nr:hypothetical protein [Vibrio penaeicida]TOA68048.1 hypothetical protein CGK21_19015 [Vibrio parahaemolyticus]
MGSQKLKTQEIDGHRFYLSSRSDGKWLMTVEPAFRSNGTQSLDGWLPRYYSKVGSAKAALTKKLGSEWLWEDA